MRGPSLWEETDLMTKFANLAKTNFHADLIRKIVLRLNNGEEPEAYVYSLATAFDDASVFRHLDFVGLRDGLLTMVHLDELPVGVRWYTHLTTVDKIKGIELGSLELGTNGAPKDAQEPAGFDPEVTPLTLFIPVSISQNVEVGPLQCDDPSCQAEHGLGGSIKDEGLLLAFTGDPEEGSVEDEVYDFAARVLGAMKQ